MRLQSQLVKSHDFSTGLQNALTGLFCDVQSSNLQFGDFKDPQVIGDGTDDNSDLIRTIFTLHFSDQSSDGNWGSVDLGISSTSQETIQLDEKSQVDIIGLRGSPADLSVFVVPDVNSHYCAGKAPC